MKLKEICDWWKDAIETNIEAKMQKDAIEERVQMTLKKRGMMGLEESEVKKMRIEKSKKKKWEE